jgi:hypothetical protein
MTVCGQFLIFSPKDGKKRFTYLTNGGMVILRTEQKEIAMTFLDWSDQNSYAAAESAVHLMRKEGYDYEGAIAQAADIQHFEV